MNSEEWQKIKEVFEATFDLSENERVKFLEKCDENLRIEVENLFKANQEADDFIAEPAMIDVGLVEENQVDDFIGKRIDSYEILQEIGQGGMGTVYLASRADGEFEQKVALKIIKRGMDTNAVLKRFMLERQILARLEHPNIAHLIDGGTTADGLPYFVMEYVEGEPITKFCDSHQLSTNERLNIFQSVCSAVSFAHQNLVVHRDIKPSNIIVTADGTPKLLDFGIAKLLNPEWSVETIEATATMFRVMTPEYASPEQIRGLPITTSADVYSLGVVLYELLSGHRPYKLETQSREEFIHAILTEEPVRPSSVVSRPSLIDSNKTTSPNTQRTNDKGQLTRFLKGDLDNIILKALRKEPIRRYASVQEFSEDISRHLTGLPVKATADTISYRVSKFVKRHRVGVLVSGLVGLTLLLATAITSWQAVVARRERDKAEMRFNQVRKLANTVLFEYHDGIEKLSGSTPIREKMVKDALEYLDNLNAEGTDDAELQSELASAYQKIGDIQGGFATSQMGQHDKALESYRKSLGIREKLVAKEPNNVNFSEKLAGIYSKLGDMMWIELNVDASLEMYQKGFEINQKLAAEMPDDKEIRYKLAMSQRLFGRILGAKGKTEESLANVRHSVTLLEELLATNPNDEKILRGLASAYDGIGELDLQATQNYSEALSVYRKSQIISDKLLATDPDNMQFKRDVAVSFYLIAETLVRLGDNQTALENSQKSLSMFTGFQAADPQNEEFKQLVASAENQFSGLLIKNGKPDEAIKRLEKSLEIRKKQLAASSNDELAKFAIAMIYENLGNANVALAAEKQKTLQQSLANWQEAKSYLQKSFEIYKDFRDSGKSTGEDAARVGVVQRNISKCDDAIKRLSGK